MIYAIYETKDESLGLIHINIHGSKCQQILWTRIVSLYNHHLKGLVVKGQFNLYKSGQIVILHEAEIR